MASVITSIFRRPAARPASSPFKPPAAVGSMDRFQPGNPKPTSILPTEKPSEPSPPGPSSLGVTSSTSAALAALGLPSAALYTAVYNLLSDGPTGAKQLEQLLEQGKLNAGTLENLNLLTREPRAEGLDGALLTRETVAILSAPDQNVWQAKRFTCGATNLERQWAENPESFTALVAGLSSPEGKSQLPGGFTLERAPGSLADDHSGRTHTDRLIQSSIMATAGAGRGTYDVATDRFSQDQGGGLKIAEIAGMTALFQNQPQVVVAYDSKSAKATQELLGKLQPGESFQTAMTNWEGRDHMLLLQGTEDGAVRYFDPAGPSEHKLLLGDFLWKTQYLVLPEALANRVTFQPESVHSLAQPK